MDLCIYRFVCVPWTSVHSGSFAMDLCVDELLCDIRGAHNTFFNLYELMTSLLCFLHHIIDQFRNTCDKKYYLILYNRFHFMRQNFR